MEIKLIVLNDAGCWLLPRLHRGGEEGGGGQQQPRGQDRLPRRRGGEEGRRGGGGGGEEQHACGLGAVGGAEGEGKGRRGKGGGRKHRFKLKQQSPHSGVQNPERIRSRGES